MEPTFNVRLPHLITAPSTFPDRPGYLGRIGGYKQPQRTTIWMWTVRESNPWASEYVYPACVSSIHLPALI